MSFPELVYLLFGLFGGGLSLGFYIGITVGRGEFRRTIRGKRKK